MFFALIVGGWNDATPGALLPSIESHYNVNFIITSLLFVANFLGSVTAAVLCPIVIDRFGLGKALSFFALLVTIPWAIFIALPPYPLFAVCFYFSGCGVAALDSMGNTWISGRPRPALRLGFLHFAYGIGAFLSPLAAAPFNGHNIRFSFFYIIALGLAALNTAGVTAAFKLKRETDEERTKDSVAERNGEWVAASTALGGTSADVIELRSMRARNDKDALSLNSKAARDTSPETPYDDSRTPPPPATPHELSSTRAKFIAVLKQPRAHIFALFTLCYVGTEVSIGGWTSTYLLSRNDPSSATIDYAGGEVAGGALTRSQATLLVSGFWGGIAVGRIALLPVTSWIGDQLAVLVYILLALALQLVTWFVPAIASSAVALALMGIFLGPIFPIMIEIAARQIRPRILHTTALSYIISLGAAGSALFPFFIGLLAQARGIQVLAPTLVAMLGAQGAIWCSLGWPVRRGRSRSATGGDE